VHTFVHYFEVQLSSFSPLFSPPPPRSPFFVSCPQALLWLELRIQVLLSTNCRRSFFYFVTGTLPCLAPSHYPLLSPIEFRALFISFFNHTPPSDTQESSNPPPKHSTDRESSPPLFRWETRWVTLRLLLCCCPFGIRLSAPYLCGPPLPCSKPHPLFSAVPSSRRTLRLFSYGRAVLFFVRSDYRSFAPLCAHSFPPLFKSSPLFKRH